jgi:hypothetical protein
LARRQTFFTVIDFLMRRTRRAIVHAKRAMSERIWRLVKFAENQPPGPPQVLAKSRDPTDAGFDPPSSFSNLVEFHTRSRAYPNMIAILEGICCLSSSYRDFVSMHKL